MSKYQIDSTTLTGIGDAIRTKGGTSALINPEDMPAAIAALPEPEPKWAPLNNGKTNYWIEIPEGGTNLQITVRTGAAGDSVNINWGDGTTQVYTPASKNTTYYVKHYYNQGSYIINLDGPSFIVPSPVIYVGGTYANNPCLRSIELAHNTQGAICDSQPSIENVAIMEGCKELGDEAFESAVNLTQIIFGKRTQADLQMSGNYHFASTAITKFELPSGILANGILNNHIVSGCKRLREIVLPNDLLTLESGDHFTNCPLLTKITIPASVTQIGSNSNLASNCSSLREINLKPTTPPSLASATLSGSLKEFTIITVPTASLSSYREDSSTGYSAVANRIFPEGYHSYTTEKSSDKQSLYEFTTTEACTFDIGQYATAFTNTSNGDGYISIEINGTEVWQQTLATTTYTVLNTFTPIALAANDVLTINGYWTGSHTNCYFYLFANPTIS